MDLRKMVAVLLGVLLAGAIVLAGCQQPATEVTTKKTTVVAIKGPGDLKGKKVGVQVDTTGQLEAEKILGKNYPNLKKYDDILTAFSDLNAGRIDAIVNDKPVSAYVVKKTYPGSMELDATIKTNEGYGIWFKKDNTQLRDATNWALKQIWDDGTYGTIYKKWFGVDPDPSSQPTGTVPAAKPTGLKTLKPGVMSFGADTAFPPFEFKEGADYVGFDVDLGKEVCKRLGMKYEIVSTAWDGIIPSLQAGKYDAIMSSMTITPDRMKEMAPTHPYIISDQSIAVKKAK